MHIYDLSIFFTKAVLNKNETKLELELRQFGSRENYLFPVNRQLQSASEKLCRKFLDMNP